MGAGASAASAASPTVKKTARARLWLEAFDKVPMLSVTELLHSDIADGTRVQVLGHVEPGHDFFTTPFFETECVAAEVVGAMQGWKPQSALDLYNASRDGGSRSGPMYRPYQNVLRAARSTSFALRDPPCALVVESPDRQNHVVFHEGDSLRVVVPSHEWGAGRHLCNIRLGHKTCAHDLRFDAAHGGILLGSQWVFEYPRAHCVSPGRAAPQGHEFWTTHMSTHRARVERWMALVNQGDQPCWMRNYKVTETTLRVGDGCCVIGEVRRSATGAMELHCGEKEPLLITNAAAAAKALPPRAAVPGSPAAALRDRQWCTPVASPREGAPSVQNVASPARR